MLDPEQGVSDGERIEDLERANEVLREQNEALQDAAEVLIANYDMAGLRLRWLHPYVEALREVVWTPASSPYRPEEDDF